MLFTNGCRLTSEETDPKTRAEGEVNPQTEGVTRIQQGFYHYILAMFGFYKAQPYKNLCRRVSFA